MDIRKIALYLSGKLPPNYEKFNTFHMFRLLQEYDKNYFTDDKLRFIKEENNDNENLFFAILDSLYRSKNESETNLFYRILEEYEVPKEFYSEKKDNINLEEEGNKLKKELQNIPGGKKNGNDKQFEELISKLINFLFFDSMEKFYYKEQPRDQENLNIRDILLLNQPISSNPIINFFWNEVVKSEFETKFITIECKNYNQYIGQEPIVTTEKYLHKLGVGRFSIIFTRKGLNTKGKEKIKELLKGEYNENGYSRKPVCFLILSDNDIYELINKKMNGELPEDFLIEKYFEVRSLL